MHLVLLEKGLCCLLKDMRQRQRSGSTQEAMDICFRGDSSNKKHPRVYNGSSHRWCLELKWKIKMLETDYDLYPWTFSLACIWASFLTIKSPCHVPVLGQESWSWPTLCRNHCNLCRVKLAHTRTFLSCILPHYKALNIFETIFVIHSWANFNGYPEASLYTQIF